MSLSKIISGAQSGVDRGALDAALSAGFPCGGYCPRGRIAEDGLIPLRYPVIELESDSYRARTIQNVLASDGTLIIYYTYLSGGTEQTLLHCTRRRKPYKLVDAAEISHERAAELARAFIAENTISILNVAGPRASQQAAGYEYALNALALVIMSAESDTT